MCQYIINAGFCQILCSTAGITVTVSAMHNSRPKMLWIAVRNMEGKALQLRLPLQQSTLTTHEIARGHLNLAKEAMLVAT